ncbi:MAG TPA: O-antigen ligase family protein [Victivallales bacterium]|nr:O-antigen ligase family protein [Victivallales bacterium]
MLKFNNLRDSLFRYKLVVFATALFILLTSVQFFIYKSYSFSEWSFSILWITLPVFAYFFHKNLKILLPVYLFFIWIVDVAYSTFQRGQVIGIAGNRNWHAVFLMVLLFFSLYFFYTIYKKSVKFYAKPLIIIISIILTLYSVYIIYLCESRGAWISLIITLVIFLIIKLYNRTLNRYIKYSIAVVAILIIFTSLSFYLLQLTSYSSSTYSDKLHHSDIFNKSTEHLNNINNSLDSDVRTPLWLGCINLIKDHPFIGIGTGRFESVYAAYRPICYFAKPLSAVRSNHPHNTLLYITACYGLIGLILWLILWLYPALFCIIKFNQLSLFKKIVLFSYLCLFIHGMLDLIFFEWPTLFIAGLLIGILWTEPWKPNYQKHEHTKKQNNVYLNLLSTAAALILLIMTVKTIYNDYMSTYNFRYGRIVQAKYRRSYEALYFYSKGLEYNTNPKYLYKAATTALLKLNDPMLALIFLNDFNNISTFDYAHKNSFVARALLLLKKPKLALPYLINAVINYPLSTGNWYRLANVQYQLGMKNSAKVSFENMYKTITYKGLPKNSLKLLLTNPDYDSHPHKIPKEKLINLKK